MNDLIQWMQPVLIPMRAINPGLAIVALVALGYRLGPALFQLWQRPEPLTVYEKQERIARVIFAGYILAAALGAAQSIYLNNAVGPVTILWFLLHLSVIITMFRWKPVDYMTVSPQRGLDRK